MLVKDFRDINFGFANAEMEGARFPDLLLEGYLDLHGISSRAVEGHEWLFLGYKGSGKTAIAERLKLMHQSDSNIFITHLNLEDFPYAAFAQIVRDEIAPEAKYPTAWSWVLLIYLLGSLQKDSGVVAEEDLALLDTLAALKKMQLLPVAGLPHLIRATTSRTFKLAIPKFLEGKWVTEDSRVDIPSYVENLKELLAGISTESRHLLILDGLDEIITTEAAQWQSLGALIFEVNRLNLLLSRTCPCAKIILLCRTDLFELLGGANKNKIRQDSALELNWYKDPRAPGQSMLVSIANMRARLAFEQATEVFDDFFPASLFRRPARKVLLDCTRHTPRDFLQLLKYIQGCCNGPRVTNNNLISGLRLYSSEYFLPEIVDELDGYVTPHEAQEFFRLVGSLRSRDFWAREVYALLASEARLLTKEKVEVILRALFECSAIGNVLQRDRGKHFLTYRFRNRHAAFNIKERLMLHRGLWRALNLPVDPTWEDELPSEDIAVEPS